MKKIVFYLIVLALLSSCAVAQNVEHKPHNKIEASAAEPKKKIKDAVFINRIMHSYSFILIGVCLSLIFVGKK